MLFPSIVKITSVGVIDATGGYEKVKALPLLFTVAMIGVCHGISTMTVDTVVPITENVQSDPSHTPSDTLTRAFRCSTAASVLVVAHLSGIFVRFNTPLRTSLRIGSGAASDSVGTPDTQSVPTSAVTARACFLFVSHARDDLLP